MAYDPYLVGPPEPPVAGWDPSLAVPPPPVPIPEEVPELPYPGASMEMQAPNDFFSRLAQGAGPQPFNFNVGRKPTGLEVILGLAAAFGNFKTAQASKKIGSVEEKNKIIRDSASAMAKQRWELKKQRESRESIEQVVRDQIAARREPKTPEQIAAEAAARTGANLEEYIKRGLKPPGSPRPPSPTSGPKPKPSTMAERSALGFYHRAKDAVDTVMLKGKGGKTLEDSMAEQGLVGQGQLQYAPNFLKSSDQQVYRQAQRQFTEARLRKESGAAIPEHEIANDARTYFVQPGDSPSVVARKRKARAVMLEALKFQSGKAYTEHYEGVQPEAEPMDSSVIWELKDGKLVPSGGR